MATFALIHGGGDGGWYWHLVADALRAAGHHVVAPDLPGDDDTATLEDYAATVVEAIGDRRDELVVVGQSYGGFTAPLVAERCGADVLVFVAGMVPSPGEAPGEWWEHTGYRDEVTTDGDPFVTYYHDVPRPLAEEAMRRERGESTVAYGQPWPRAALPDVRTRFVLCTEDRFFPPAFLRRVVAERLAIEPDEIAAGHCVALSRPNELAALLAGYVDR
jgi:pimeloyl-ACP methyl ester carboxylesterase